MKMILFDPSLVIEKDFTIEAGYEAAFQLLKNKLDFDSIFAGNDLMAIGVVKGLQEQGIKIPVMSPSSDARSFINP
ncbi:hypothetical protein AB6A23_13825 [Paenibacillus tarimensis]